MGPVNEVGQGAETVEINADVENLDSFLIDFPGTSALTKENEQFQVTLKESFTTKDLNSYLFEKGITANHLVTKRKSLEKMFLEILAESH